MRHLIESFQRSNVTVDEIENVDVVAHTSAVDGVVVLAEHFQRWQFTDCNARDEGQQVVGNAVRILA